jgi:hypothetical protein
LLFLGVVFFHIAEMKDKIRIFTDDQGGLKAFAVHPDDLFTIRVVFASEIKQDPMYDTLVDIQIRHREIEGWDVLSRCDVVGTLSQGHPDKDFVSIKKYYLRRGAELTPLSLPSDEELAELHLHR